MNIAAVRLGLAYGVLGTRRRARSLLLPAVTTATGAFLLVQVLSLTATVRKQAAAIGNESELFRATVLIAVVVLLVGVVEVAICTTRTVVHRTREIGVLGATGVSRPPVVAALLVEPVVAATVGAAAGGLVAVGAGLVATAAGVVGGEASAADMAMAFAVALVTAGIAALVTSVVPVWRAASKSPVRSLS